MTPSNLNGVANIPLRAANAPKITRRQPRYQGGILPNTSIRTMFGKNQIKASIALDEDQIQPASLDLRLGDKAYRVRASFLPGKDHCVSQRLETLKLHEVDLAEGAVLEVGCVYLIPLMEELNLPDTIKASTNPKSSTGRLDIFTRVLSDKAELFDQIKQGYKGKLYLEVCPQTFPILVRQGSRLSQIRFRTGQPTLDAAQTLQAHQEFGLVSDDEMVRGSGVDMSIDLQGHGDNKIIGYRGKRHTGVVDVDKRSALAVNDFWEPIYNVGDRTLILDPHEFYILVSREAVHVPPDFAAEMVPFDPLVGEFRVHYAGFFDPGFGHASAGGTGSRAVLEVRNHEVPFILEHGQTIGKLIYEHMLLTPDRLYGADLKSHYQAQGLKLSKHFK